MDGHPFLLPVDPSGGSFLFAEADDQGAKYVQVNPGGYAPLNSYQNTAAAPFFRAACDCGSLNPDATCVSRGSDLTHPFNPQVGTGSELQFRWPFELAGSIKNPW